MKENTTISAQEKWTKADANTRGKMLDLIGWSRSFTGKSWKKLPHIVHLNFNNKVWTNE